VQAERTRCPQTGADVCAVLVTYHPDATFAAQLGGVLRQVGAVIIVDNGSTEIELRMLRGVAANPAVELVFNAENLGIARGLNIGIQRAIARGYRWALLLDQDSRIDLDMVPTLLATHAAYPDRVRLAIIGSGFREICGHSPEPAGRRRRGGATPAASQGESWVSAESVITSGSLLPLATYAVVGPFREEFFIDHVDTDYCFRARAKGYLVIKTRRPLMSHAIGAPTQHQLLWMNKWTTNHTADRRYYIARNGTVVLREYGHYAAGLWALKSLARCFRLCKRIALYENDRAGKIAAVALGLWDGMLGNMGPRRRRRDGSAPDSPVPRSTREHQVAGRSGDVP
jgi:rhamnosyltransferase